MGGAVSAGEDNDNLVDNLVSANYIRTEKLIDIFRAVDRGHYYLKGHRSSAYHDIAWKLNHLHLSAPCIYSEVMEHLDLQPGMSFLNLGSGTGYLSTMAGLVLGSTGINHGIEIHADVVDYAREKLKEYMAMAPAFDRFEFCEPKFTVGNCLLLPPDTPGYDRVYCGAACPPEYASYLMNLLNIGGKLVLPLEDQLQVKTRTGEQAWESENALSVSFANLITPNSSSNDVKMTKPPDRSVATLQELARFSVRRVIRQIYKVEMPPKKTRKKRDRHASLSTGPNGRKVGSRIGRRRLNTTGGSRTRHLRRRRNTSGDSDHEAPASGSGESDDSDDSDNEMDVGITDATEESQMVTSAADSKETPPCRDLASDTKDISLEDEKGEKKCEGENSKGETSTNHSQRSHFKFLRKCVSKQTDDTEQEIGEQSHGSETKTEALPAEAGQEGEATEEGAGDANADEQQRPPMLRFAQQTSSDEGRRVLRALRSGRLAYTLMRGLRRHARERETNEAIGLRSAIGLALVEESGSEDSSSDNEDRTPDQDGEIDGDNSGGSDSDDIFKPLPETQFTIAIRRLPLPTKLISFLLFHRQ